MNRVTCVVSNWSALRIVGDTAAALLQGQLTCDCTPLQQQGFGAACNTKGRIVANFVIVLQNIDDYLLFLPSDSAALLLAHLRVYAPFYRGVQLQIMPQQVVVCWCAELADTTDAKQRMQYALANCSWRIAEAEYNSEDTATNERAWHAWCIQHLLYFVDAATSGEKLVHELGLHLLAVSFEKGCYTGQEIVARVHYRGKSKKIIGFGTLSSAIHCNNAVIIAANEVAGHVLTYVAGETTTYVCGQIQRKHTAAELCIGNEKLQLDCWAE